MITNDGAVIVLTTVGDDAVAHRLAIALVEERLAACVTRSTVKSVFRWDGGAAGSAVAAGVAEEDEVLLVIKTAASRAVALEARLKELHPYECPEIVTIRAERVDAKYLEWLLASSAASD